MERPFKVKGMDIPIVKLTPIRKRSVSAKSYTKLLSNLKAVGLIEPLCACKDGDQYFIVDGFIRYQALLELGVQIVPCLILESKDIYTPNRQVNHLSPQQEVKMLRKALQHMDEKTIAHAFGIQALGTRLRMRMRHDLHTSVLEALDTGVISQDVAQELSYVVHKRQLEILALMRDAKDYSLPFARSQVFRTAVAMRIRSKRRNPWDKHDDKKRGLVKKLQDVEKHHDFYSGLYRQYSGDLLKLAIYVRQLLNRPRIHSHLATQYPDIFELFESLSKESEGNSAVV